MEAQLSNSMRNDQEMILDTSKRSTSTLQRSKIEPTKSFKFLSSSAEEEASLAHYETRAVRCLRLVVLIVLVIAATVVGVLAYDYALEEEIKEFERNFEANAFKLVESFHNAIDYRLGAFNSFANALTSYSIETGNDFPFVTLPDFSIRGADTRILSGAHVFHWLPLVSDADRERWEEYAFEERGQIDKEFQLDRQQRTQQDKDFADVAADGNVRFLQNNKQEEEDADGSEEATEEIPAPRNNTVVDDGSGYHMKIFSNGALEPQGDQPNNTGPYLPIWQRSPVSGAKQRILNLDFSRTNALKGVLPIVQRSNEAVLNWAIVPIPSGRAQLEASLKISQFRNDVEAYLNDPASFLTYPVFDGFTKNRTLAGVLVAPLYWSLILQNSVTSVEGIFCVIENSFNQTFTYQIDSASVEFLGMDDLHDESFDYLELSADVNRYLRRHAAPSSRAYTTVPLNEDFGQYKIRVYASAVTKDAFTTNRPLVFLTVVLAAFLFTSIVFLLFVYVVEQRQQLVLQIAIDNAEKAAETERELNEFLSHEVRNPLAAAMVSMQFVASAADDLAKEVESKHGAPEFERTLSKKGETLKALKEDINIVDVCLTFINDFLRSMLDMHRANADKLQLKASPIDIKTCIFEPINTMVRSRDADYEFIVDCPDDLIVMTDSLRLKQIVLNLVRNSAKFIHHGFIRLRADVRNGMVCLYVEDSGPGIPLEKRQALFQKFQSSLDMLSQGTGVGLCLCKSLIDAMGGEISLDDSFQSGVVGSPGVSFVIALNQPQVRLESFEKQDEKGTKDSVVYEIETRQFEEAASEALIVANEKPNELAPTALPESLKVLFVDDDNMVRKLFARAVKRVAPGWNVQEAANGETALRLVEADEFDLIFMDMYMASVNKQLLGTVTHNFKTVQF
ncbi:unnamed protein product [Cylindrotheca closterium]|uniref:histidine kinase n=1 Tax=Cylindrotheca closterium TaxID=2856 RepID=A0AAD2FET5_9STRA|nr:unnamed protein product [Cylindrotheca closterium]